MTSRMSRKNFRLRLDEMVGLLREEIVSGQWSAGSFLPSESDLETRFGLSNSSVRKALQVLVEEGLIEKIARVGNRVKQQQSAGEQKTLIRFGYVQSFGHLAELELLLDEFRRKYPHIDVQPLELPQAGYSKAAQHYLESEFIDVVLINNNAFQDFAENGCERLLEPLEPSDECASFLIEPFMKDNRTLVQPFIYSPVVLCYNKSHFREADVPEPDSSWTWHDLFQYGKQLAVDQERFGFYFFMPSRNRWPIFMLQSGESLTPDAEGNYRVAGTRLLDSLQTCRELLAMTGVFPAILSESDADAEALFADGKVSIIMTTYFYLNHLRKSGIAFDVSPLPALNEGTTLLVVNGLAVNSLSRNKEAAKLLVDYLTSYEAQLLIRRKTLNIAANRRAMEWTGEEATYRPSRFQMYREIIPTFRLIAELGLTNRQLKRIQLQIMLFMSGLQDAGSLAEKLERLLPEAAAERSARR